MQAKACRESEAAEDEIFDYNMPAGVVSPEEFRDAANHAGWPVRVVDLLLRPEPLLGGEIYEGPYIVGIKPERFKLLVRQ